MSRRFGVEIEHRQPKMVCGAGCSIRKPDHISCQARTLRLTIEKTLPGVSVTPDGSGCELRTPILQGEKGMKSLEATMTALRELGGTVTKADGLHVHHDAPEYLIDDDELAKKRIVNLAQSWCNNQAIINDLVLPHRRDDWFKCEMSGYSPTNCYKQVTSAVVERIKAAAVTEGPSDYYGNEIVKCKPSAGVARLDRMYALNVTALGKTGTIEIRQYQGTLNFDRARAWIRFGQCFIDTVLQDDETPLAPYRTIDLLMRDMGLDSYERGILEKVGT